MTSGGWGRPYHGGRKNLTLSITAGVATNVKASDSLPNFVISFHHKGLSLTLRIHDAQPAR